MSGLSPRIRIARSRLRACLALYRRPTGDDVFPAGLKLKIRRVSGPPGAAAHTPAAPQAEPVAVALAQGPSAALGAGGGGGSAVRTTHAALRPMAEAEAPGIPCPGAAPAHGGSLS